MIIYREVEKYAINTIGGFVPSNALFAAIMGSNDEKMKEDGHR